MKGKIILLNGVSSAGKSTLAKSLVKLLPDYFHFGIDDFDLVIEKMEDRSAERLIPVDTETFFHRAITMFADQGVNLIVDHVVHNAQVLADARHVLQEYDVCWIGVFCSREELTRRERERGDRRIGLAVEQLTRVHQQNEPYHFHVDTTEQSADVCAKQIAEYLEQHNS